MPILAEGRLLAFAVSLAHRADIGGGCPSFHVAATMEALQEALRILPLRLFTAEGPDPE
ncbi:hydantoinase B/oxoprolinase family protein [Siccirubricoccus sp. G192]|uniref:hydantoinase B/oxoprolinase family protein n=1 Tax=Siccirubricoccus sp. G192 TaxID=2849651 RepID=UPI001C2C4FA7|nr:hydantoinase B/oxoprolinase family protein [Siccirubricoccus sp. G192]MBV1797822.1 hydantoinase B/oxoprolinase family protein [Siccirubricoccus sp. G192]